MLTNLLQMVTTDGNAERRKAIKRNAVQGKARHDTASQSKAMQCRERRCNERRRTARQSSEVRRLHTLPKPTGLVSYLFDMPVKCFK